VAVYFFLALISNLQGWVFTDLPEGLGFNSEPTWWPLLPLFLAGLLVGLTIRYLPGRGGHSPADGFHTGGGPPMPIELPGIVLAALAGLALGAVIGPEAPLIAIGAGLAALVLRLVQPDVPRQQLAVVAATGSFAAISTLVGSPLVAAFLMMEAAGVGGAMLGMVLVPGLLSAGIGFLIFIGLDSLTGLGTFSLAIPDVPSAGRPEASEFLWAIVIGLAAALLGWAIRWLALTLRPYVERRVVLLTTVAGLVVAAMAIAYAEATDKSTSDVLFSGQTGLGPLVQRSAEYSVGALVLLILFKSLAYGVSLSSFRGGPIFPALFIGAAGGIALSHAPGLTLPAGLGMGIGAMSCVMLGLPLTSALLASLLLVSTSVDVLPLVVVAIAVAYVARARLLPLLPGQAPRAARPGAETPGPAPAD
jgi:chloride channel protein, CIC family